MSKIFNINPEDQRKIRKFVKARLEDSALYHKRGGFKEEDIISGAMAEFACYYYLKERGLEISEPDLNIYDAKDKSYSADLVSGKKKFHVKSQTKRSQRRYGNSWLLQRYDKIVQKPLQGHYLMLCTTDIDEANVELLGIPTICSIHRTDSWEECKVWSFRKTKVALYMDTLYNRINNMWAF